MTTNTSLYLVSFASSGATLGVYEASSEDQAVALACKDAGYVSLASAAEALDKDVSAYRDSFNVKPLALDGHIAYLNGEVLGWGETANDALAAAFNYLVGFEDLFDDVETFRCDAAVAHAFKAAKLFSTPEIIGNIAVP
jgi:hypothetical protein